MQQDIERYRPSLLIAHNIEFDRNVLLSELVREGGDLLIDKLPTYCTMQSSIDLCQLPDPMGKYKWPRLEELHQKLFGCGFEGAHDAGSDVLACARCYYQMQAQGGSALSIGSENRIEENRKIDEGVQDMIDRIIDWAGDNPWFGIEFIESVQEQLEDRSWVSDAQISALKNIIDKFDID